MGTVQRRPFLLLMSIFALAMGCSGAEGPPRDKTYPVTGQVIVDGQPAPYLLVELHDATKKDAAVGAVSTAYTDDQGKFEISTYQSGDGAPEGDFVVTFMWGQLELLRNEYAGPDKLKDKYRDPQKSTFKIKVEKGKPADMGRIELTTS